jgi:hypothetical protein
LAENALAENALAENALAENNPDCPRCLKQSAFVACRQKRACHPWDDGLFFR